MDCRATSSQWFPAPRNSYAPLGLKVTGPMPGPTGFENRLSLLSHRGPVFPGLGEERGHGYPAVLRLPVGQLLPPELVEKLIKCSQLVQRSSAPDGSLEHAVTGRCASIVPYLTSWPFMVV